MGQNDLALFWADPPRLFPHCEHQRPKIEGFLITLAAQKDKRYEERLEKYNALAEKYGAQGFKKYTVTETSVNVEEPTITAEPSEPVTETAVGEVQEAPKKRGRRKSITPTTHEN